MTGRVARPGGKANVKMAWFGHTGRHLSHDRQSNAHNRRPIFFGGAGA